MIEARHRRRTSCLFQIALRRAKKWSGDYMQYKYQSLRRRFIALHVRESVAAPVVEVGERSVFQSLESPFDKL